MLRWAVGAIVALIVLSPVLDSNVGAETIRSQGQQSSPLSATPAAERFSDAFRVAIADAKLREEMIAGDIQFREGMNLRADRAYVRSLYDDLSLTVGNRMDGALLTPEEDAEVTLRDALEDDATVVESALKGSPEYGGIYLDNAAGGIVVVLLTSPDAEADIPSVAHPERFTTRIVKHSLNDLTMTYDAISDAMLQGRSVVADVREVEVRVSRNTVIVTFKKGSTSAQRVSSGELPTAFVNEFGTEGMTFEASTIGQMGVDYSLECDTAVPPLRGGHAWGKSGGNCGTFTGFCSIGFQMDRASYPDADWALTAGHCWYPPYGGVSKDDPVYHRLLQFGFAGVHYYTLEGGDGTGLDMGLIRVPNKNNISDDVIHDFVSVDVDAVQTSNNEGWDRCFTGFGTADTRCGQILSSDLVTTTACGGVRYHVIKMDLTLTHGDSGGPLYHYVRDINRARAVAIESCAPYDGAPTQYMPLVTYTPSNWQVSVSTTD